MRKLLLLFFLMSSLAVKAQFSGDFTPSKWTFASTTDQGDGSINVAGAPNSIKINGSDNSRGLNSNGAEYYFITLPYPGTISFDYNLINPDVETAYYFVNSTETLISSGGSGTVNTVAVKAGDVFGFKLYNYDNCCGRGELTISNFTFVSGITLQPINAVACEGNSVSFEVGASGVTSYQWQTLGNTWVNVVDAGVFSGATSNKLQISDVTGLQGNQFRCIVNTLTESNLISNVVTLTVNSVPGIVSQPNSVSDYLGQSASLTVSATSTGTPTYQWKKDGAIINGATAATLNISSLSSADAGSYTVDITNACGTVTSAPALVVLKSVLIAGYLNGLKFDGTNDYVEIPSQASNQFSSETEFTVSLWFKANSMATAGLFNRPSGGGGDMQFWLTAENGIFTYGIDKHGYGWTWIATEKAYEFGEWVHVTTVRRNVSGQRRMEIYANGKLVGSGTVNYTSSASGAPIRIGTHKDANSFFADGQIDNVSLWKKALTVEEIKSLAVTTLNGNEAGLAGFWRFNETSGTIAYDATPNANHGIIKDMGLSAAWSSLNAGEVITLKNEAYRGFLTARDESGNPLTYSIVTAPVNGTLTIGNAATGAFTYTPNANYIGPDMFSYRISNGADISNTATVNVTVVPENKAPIPDLAELSTLTGECAVTVIAPTANDDNDGVITGTTTDPLSYQEQGNYTITWTYRDKEGLTSTQTQQVIVKDETKPVFATVASINKNNDAGKCGAVVTYTMPTAIDNCVPAPDHNAVNVLNRGAQLYDHVNRTLVAQQSPGLPITFVPTNGNKMAVFLVNNSTTARLSQNVLLPSAGPVELSFDLQYKNHYAVFDNSNQFMSIEIRNSATDALLKTVFRTEIGAALAIPMTSFKFDISEFAGQNVKVVLANTSIQYNYFDILLDNVKIPGSSLVNGSFETGDYTGWTITESGAGTWGIGSGIEPPVTIKQIAGLPSGSLFPVGKTTNTFTATDAVGNTSTISFDVTITDTQKPTVATQNITVALDANGKATITAADIDNGSADNCAIATEGYSLSKTSFTCEDLGLNTVTLTVTDVHGNEGTGTATVNVFDGIDPTITAPAAVTVNTDAGKNTASNVALGTPTIADNCSDVSVTNNAPATFPLGTTIVTWTVTDVAGNAVTATQTVTVETIKAPSAPDLLSSSDSGSSDSDNITNNNSPIFQGTAPAGTTVTLYANGNAVGSTTANSTGTWSITASELAEGTHTFTAKAVDASGSESPTSSGLSITIDLTAPDATITTGPASMTSSANATFTFTSSEAGTFEASIDGSAFTAATSPLSLIGLSEGNHTLMVRAIDAAGNIDATPASYTWLIDTTAPTITGITRYIPAEAYINTNTVTYLVTLSEAVSGVDVSDFSLTTTGSAAGTLTGVSVFQKDYLVSVSGISGSGTMRLDVKASGTGIVDAVGNVLSAGYSSGEVYTIDTTSPTVTLLSVPAKGTYRADQHLDFIVDFNENVTIGTVDGTPTLGLTIGSTSQEAAYVSGSGSASVIFRYTVQQGDQDMNGITLGGITLNGGTITDAIGNSAVLSLSGVVPSTAGILVDAVAPTLQTVTIASSNSDVTKAKAGDIVTLSLEASEPIAQPIITIAGQTATVTAVSTSAYSATYKLTATDAEGTVPFTITYQDLAGNAGTAVSATTNSSSVTFDKTAPVVNVKDITIQLNNTGAATITAATIDNGSSDNDGIASMTVSKTTFDCNNVGANNVVLTVTDLSGNTSTATATITVEDKIAPVVKAIASKSITIPAGRSANWNMYRFDFTDPLPAGAVMKGITLNYSGRDQGWGGTGASAHIVVSDTHIGSNIFLAKSQNFTLNYTGSVPGYVYGGNNFMRVDFETWPGWEANFEGGTMTILYESNTLPDITAECSVTVSTIPTAEDNCAGTITGKTTDPLTYTEQGTYTITWRFDDGNGNVTTATQKVIVKDTQKPTVVTQNITVNLDATGKATITAADIDNGSADNCAIATEGYSLSQTEFTCADLGTKTVTLTVTDVNGNSETATAIVTIVDNINPTITAPVAVTVNTDAGKNTASNVALGTPTIADNCSGVSVTNDAPAAFPLGTTIVTWTVTDAAGNTATATQEVTVEDNEAPVPTIATLPTITGQCGATVTAVPTAEDNVSGTVAGKTTDLLSYTAQGTYTITWTYEDEAGNTSSQTQQVIVKDDTAPVVATRNINVQLDANGKASITAAMIDAGSEDNCGIASMTLDQTEFTCGGTTTVTLTVTDVNGNVATGTATVTVEDKVAPVAKAKNITVALDAAGKATILASDVDHGSEDNCGIASLTLSKTAFDCSNVGDNTVTLTVTDNSGNTHTATAIVTVEDNINPTITAPAAVVVDVDAGKTTASNVSLGTPVTADNCAVATVTNDAPATFPTGTTTVTWTVTDASGNTATARQTVTVRRDVIAVTTPATVNVPIRTTFANVPLPPTVTVTYSDNTTAQLGVTWKQGNYNGLVAGSYSLTGELVLATGTTNTEGKTATITVVVEPNKVPTALAFSATTFAPNIKADEAIGTLSTTDPDDTQFVYTLVSGSGDTDNSLFEIQGDKVYLKTNTGLSGRTSFSFRVRSTDPYQNTIEKAFTLTKGNYGVAADKLKIVNAFSPNGDGINDTWSIPELRFYNNVEVEVFDRAGVRLFHSTNPEMTWDGRSANGQILQGAFFYIVQIKDIHLVKKGVVTILKK